MKTGKNQKRRWSARGAVRGLLASLVVCGAVLTGLPAMTTSSTASAAVLSAPDQIILRTGTDRVINGEILEETDTHIRMRISVAGIRSEVTYDKRDVLSVKRGVGAQQEETRVEDARGERRAARRADAGAGEAKVYVAEFKGNFGRDLTATPFREVMQDAARNGANVIVLSLDVRSLLAFLYPGQEVEVEEIGNFDEFSATEEILRFVQVEMGNLFDQRPRIVVWVKDAMGGASFLPFLSKEVYFHPNAKMGGIGNLDIMFGNVGDEVAREKQVSLRIGRAEGLLIEGGYPVEIIRAMTMRHEAWSYRLEGGRPVFRRGEPDAGRGEIMLTDDARGENEDTLFELVRGLGNDTLTLNADLALTLGVSKGTVGTLDDLLRDIGVGARAQRVDDRASSITEGWSTGVANAERQMRRQFREFNEIQVQGDYDERTRARGRQIRILEGIQRLVRRYGEAVNPRLGIPSLEEIQTRIEQIKLQQLADRR